MSSQTRKSKEVDVLRIVNQLSERVSEADKDDLSALAQMHGWCEELAEHYNATAQTGTPAVDKTQFLARSLEALILGEADDTDAAFTDITAAVNDLSALLSGASTPEADTGRQEATGSNEPGDDVAAKLARVFDELPPEPEDSEPSQESIDALADEPDIPTEESAQDDLPADTPAEPTPEQNPVAEQPPAVEETQTETPAEELYEQQPLHIDQKELEFIKAFVEEAYEHVEAIEGGLIEVERTPDDTAKIDDLFRPFHTIKGMAGFLNLRDINCLTHEVETLLDQGRKGKRAMTAGIIDLIFNVIDVLKVQIQAVGNYAASPSDEAVPQPPIANLIVLLRDVVAGRHEPESKNSGSQNNQDESSGESRKLGENLVDQGATQSEIVDYALEVQKTHPEKKTGEILRESKAVNARQVSQALRSQNLQNATAKQQNTVGDSSIRIDTTKLDALVDMVGELVIAQTLVTGNGMITSDPKLTKDVGQVTKIIRDVQEVAMSMRMVPIGPTFNKMSRLVRDVSRKANKQVELTISGEDTELDKNVIQQISDPLVHMVRNAVDHGIEASDKRLAAGKGEIGQVHLGAYHHGGNIVIEISDDGKGLDAKSLIKKATEKGILQPGEELSDAQAFDLIFAPGFSTAEKVTDISGRGVGMDVVRRNIEQLRGKVEISSEKGKGSTFSIRLPLTLAIIDGMVVAVGKEKFIIPTISIEQSLQPRPEQITTVQQKGEVLNVRGQLIPLLQLGQMFNLTGRIDPCETMVVIVNYEGRQIGLVVDELIGQQQVVIKTLGERFENLQGICGAAILGDGRVGLILEVSGLSKLNHSFIGQRITRSAAPEVASDSEPQPVCAIAENQAALEPAACC